MRQYIAIGCLAVGLVSSPSGLDAAEELSLQEIREQLSAPDAHRPFVPEVPYGFEELVWNTPEDNPITPAKIELGRQLFFDPRLSRTGEISCHDCHQSAHGFSDPRPRSIGQDGTASARNAPTLLNRAFARRQFWDGRVRSLEEQALHPLSNPSEMGSSPDQIIHRLTAIPGYRLQFREIFDSDPTLELIAKALATFERTLLTHSTPWDAFLQSREPDRPMRETVGSSLSESALKGAELFLGKARCIECHVGPNLTDERFHNIGVGPFPPRDTGRENVTGKGSHFAAFKTPTLRGIATTAPYMHDGSLATLEDVIEHYDRGGIPNENLSSKMVPLGLTSTEKQNLLALLEEAFGGWDRREPPRLPASVSAASPFPSSSTDGD